MLSSVLVPLVISALLVSVIVGVVVAGVFLVSVRAAARSSRPLQKALWGSSALLVVVATCLGSYVAARTLSLFAPPPAPLVNVPAPVPNSLTLIMARCDVHSYGLIVVAVHGREGSVAWQSSLEHVPCALGRLTVSGTTVYVLGQDTTAGANGVWALRTTDGAVLWHSILGPAASAPDASGIGAPNFPLGPPVLADGLLYVRVQTLSAGSERGQLSALRTTDGSRLWSQALDAFDADASAQPLAAGGGLVLLGARDGSLRAFAAQTGALVWRVPLFGSGTTPEPVLAAGIIYVVGCYLGPVTALRARDGTLLWRLAAEIGGCLSPLVVTGERLYVLTHLRLRAFAAHDGRLLWDEDVLDPGSAGIPPGGTARVAELGGVVYFSRGSYLDALRASDGHRLWRHHSNSNVGFHTPVAFQGVLFVSTYVAYPHYFGVSCPPNCEPPEALDALSSADGTIYWRLSNPASDPLFLISGAP